MQEEEAGTWNRVINRNAGRWARGVEGVEEIVLHKSLTRGSKLLPMEVEVPSWRITSN